MYNIHPLVVHFPIACLTLYTAIEVISLFSQAWARKLQTTKYLLLFIGVGTARAALQTGEIAEDLMGGGGDEVVDVHEDFAKRTYWVYIIIAIIYLLRIVIERGWIKASDQIRTILHHRILDWIIALAAIAGFSLLMITGALGGAIVYGPDTDPVVKIVYDLFVK